MDNTSFLNITISQEKAENRTSPVYVAELGKLSLQDILEKKPDDFNKQIDISWISDALNKKAMEVKYAPWDALYMPYGLWCASAYGDSTIIAAASDGNIALTQDFCKTFQEKIICDKITDITYGENIFAISSFNGKVYISEDNGISWQEILYENYDFTCIAFYNGTFLLGTACGKIFASMDKFQNFTCIAEYENVSFTKLIYVNKIIIALSSNESQNCIYSTDFGSSWNTFNMPFSQGSSITYGKGKFIACSLDTNQICICSEKDIYENIPVWQNVALYKDEPFSDISYGANVFCMVSLNGTTMASYDGIKWIETKCPEGSWANLLRTEYFFIAFSISTGKENGKYPVYSDDLLIECTSMDTRQIKITNISQDSSIENYDDINISGIYIIEKPLTNAPFEHNIIYLLVQTNGEKIYQFASMDYNFAVGYKREFSSSWQQWEEAVFSENDIVIKKESTFLENSHILMNNERLISKVDKNDLFANIITSLLEHGKNYKWVETQNYTQGAFTIGSDNALYYCLQDNGAELSKIYNPVSSEGYWIKIIDSHGKVNANNLSVILGSFALLNELSLNDDKLKDILSINKGGTGADNFQTAANNILKDTAETTTMADSEYLYIYSNENVKKISLSSLNNILKASLPVGFIYMQLRGQSTPDVLFNTTGKWQDISNQFAGEFFRVSGGNSASFGSVQNEGLPNITGSISGAICMDTSNVSGSFNASSSFVRAYALNGGGIQGYRNLNFYASSSNGLYGASAHVTPYNSAIRIWKKIS